MRAKIQKDEQKKRGSKQYVLFFEMTFFSNDCQVVTFLDCDTKIDEMYVSHHSLAN